MDVAIEAGCVAKLGHDLDPDKAERTWDLAGLVVAPGLVDIHVHTTLGPGGGAAFSNARAGWRNGPPLTSEVRRDECWTS